MPVLAQVRERYVRERPLEGVRVAACLHVTAETANLVDVLIAGGAEVGLCAANPLSTQDDVVAALRGHEGARVQAALGRECAGIRGARRRPGRARATGDDRRRGRSDRTHPRDRPAKRGGDAGRHRGDDRGPAAGARPGGARGAGVPGAGGQRVTHRAGLQRPLRHGAVDGRWHPAGHEPAARRAYGGDPGIWLDR